MDRNAPAGQQQQGTVPRFLHSVQALGWHQGARVLIREGLTLAVGALGAHVRTVCHLVGLGETPRVSPSRGGARGGECP